MLARLLSKGIGVAFLITILVVDRVVLPVSLNGPSSPFVYANASPTIRYVASTGTDQGDCSLPELPCRTIQYAVNQASSGDTIRVAAGTYTYNHAVDHCDFLPEQGKSVICVVDKTLTILGGYSVSDWSTANPGVNLTIIEGENRYRGVFLIGYNTTDTSLTMEGFTIQNCRAEGPNTPGDPNGFGGGMLVSGARVTLRDIIFKNNKVLGQNTGSGAGGAGSGAGLAINWSQPGTSSLLERVTFEGNQSFGGTGPERGGVAFGALFVNGSITVNQAVFLNNKAIAGSSSGSGRWGDLCADALGGAIGGGGGTWELHHLTVIGNQVVGGNALECGGGGFGGGVYIERGSSLILTDSLFKENVARGGKALNGGFGAGGGILVNNTPATIESTQLIANSVIGGESTGGGYAGPGGGGGLYLWGTRADVNPEASVINTIIADNYVAIGSSGNTSQGGGGGGIQVQGLQANIIHTTITRNRLQGLVSGQGLLVLATPGVRAGIANVRYSIIADHTEGAPGAVAVLVQQGNTINFQRGLFAGNTKNTNVDGSPMPPGTITGLDSMINASSPGFASPGAPNYDYHLTPGSPAIGQATGSTTPNDIDGQLRPYGGAADLGADEYFPPMLSVTPREITVLTEGDASIARRVLVNVENTTRVVTWTATTSASWLFLGPSGTAQEVSGQSGEWLQLWFKPEGLAQGTYQTDVLITSSDAEPVTLKVRMLKVEQVFSAYLPLILRQSR